MSLAIAQIKPVIGAPERNADHMIDMINEARRNGAETIIFPELAVCGPVHDDLAFSEVMQEDCWAAAQRVAHAALDIDVVFGVPEMVYGRLFSRLYLAKDQVMRTLFCAAAAPCWFGGPAPYPGEPIPFDITVDGQYRRVLGLMGDWRDKPLPMGTDRADIAISFSPQPIFAEAEHARPASGQLPMIFLSQTGVFGSGKTNYVFPGHSVFFSRGGDIVASAPYFEEGVYYWNWNGGDTAEEKDADTLLGQGLIYGVRDFFAAAHLRSAVIGISGGIDSALAACIYREALGAENVYLISMPSNFNSTTTKDLARGMAKGLGLPFAEIPIDQGRDQLYDIFDQHSFTAADGGEIKVPLSQPVKENIMARERARILAAAAAGLGGVFTCNGNKAEMTVGYSTFYGDLAGALAAQADLWKYQVYKVSSWFQKQFPQAPLDEIAAIRPSAELSDAQSVDKGLGDPLIYAYHDHLLRSWVEQGADPADTLRSYKADFLERQIGCESGLINKIFPDAAAFVADVERWWKMYRGIGIAKRMQAPPLLAFSQTPFGEGKPQTQGEIFFSREYLRTKEELLK